MVRVRSFENRRQQFIRQKEFCSSLALRYHYEITKGSVPCVFLFRFLCRSLISKMTQFKLSFLEKGEKTIFQFNKKID